MRTVVIAGVALGCLAVSGCGVARNANTSVSQYEAKYRGYATVLLCNKLDRLLFEKQVLAVSKVLKDRNEDCQRFKSSDQTITIKNR